MQSDEEQFALLSLSEDKEKEVIKKQGDLQKGARPKIRNPKEAKRRRFVLKQAKTIAKPQLLESVSETEEGMALLSKAHELNDKQGQENKKQEFFGVRSYVHTFYEAMAMDNNHSFEEGSHFGSSFHVRKKGKQIIYYRLIFGFGCLVLLMGLITLLVGFLVPKKLEIIDVQEDIEIINRGNQAFNRDLEVSKIVGISLFCFGGIVMTIVIFAFILMIKHSFDVTYSEDILLGDPEDETEQGPSSPIDVKVPVTEEITAVQPKSIDPEEVVMTNAGLCKVP